MSDTLEIRVGEEVQAKATFGPESDGITRYKSTDGTINSVYPPTSFLTFGNWIFQVPPFKPDSILMLGYAGGTVAGLIRLLYGNVPITAVDLKFYDNRYEVQEVWMDAEGFINQAGEFDCVIIDLFNGQMSASAINQLEFAAQIARITKRFLIIHVDPSVDLEVYSQFFVWLRTVDLTFKIYYFKKPDDPTDYRPH